MGPTWSYVPFKVGLTVDKALLSDNAEYALMCAGEVVLMGAVRGGHELPHNHFGIIF